MQNASSNETSKPLMTTSGMARVMSPKVPPVTSKGANAATVVSTPTMTGARTPCAPRLAATGPV